MQNPQNQPKSNETNNPASKDQNLNKPAVKLVDDKKSGTGDKK
jgi:hypothetical protein